MAFKKQIECGEVLFFSLLDTLTFDQYMLFFRILVWIFIFSICMVFNYKFEKLGNHASTAHVVVYKQGSEVFPNGAIH